MQYVHPKKFHRDFAEHTPRVDDPVMIAIWGGCKSTDRSYVTLESRPQSLESSNQLLHDRSSPKHPTLRPHHLHGRAMQVLLARRTTVLHEQTVVSSIVGLPHSSMHADVRGQTAKDQMFYSLNPEQQIEVRVCEGSLAWLVYHWLAWNRLEGGNEVVACFAADQETA